MKAALAITFLSILAFGASANAAIISITSQNSVDSPDYDLTNVYGTSDWAYWNGTPNGGVPLNQKSGATLIGNLSVVGAGALQGSSSTTGLPVHDFVFTDGTSGTETSPKSNIIGLFSNSLNTVGSGVQVSVTAPTAEEFSVYLWATGFEADGTLTATVGAASASNSSLDQSSTRDPGRFYSILVDPDFAGQVVNLSLTMTGDNTPGSGSSHVAIAAVAVNAPVQAVPEPQSIAVWSLLGIFGLAIGACVWRRK